MDAKSVLIDALDIYSSEIQTNRRGDVTSLLKHVQDCKDYAENNDVTVGWLKSHYMIILPAIKSYRVFVSQMLEDADRDKDEERLAKYLAERETLQACYALLKPFQKFMP